MGKLRLEIDQLTVESFDTSIATGVKGTVFGEQCSCNWTDCDCPSGGGYTCNFTVQVFKCCPI